ncbi:EAL domain-containing protein [Massilia litorea]|uniref:EAL domain-containing protein n=1 Tax=Massilia litorea TaxID=2769491 RepID=A0A7L9U0T0_9BURK|nr:EAL domain-containing protein [Massilia litorea]QOL48614.1 EAL domain-containing protein [Massilia litorea]
MPGALLRLLLFACLVLPALAAAAPLRVVMDQNYPPYTWRNAEGKLEGYTVDLWRLWQKKTGQPVELIPANWAQALPMLEEGKADVIDPIFLTPARVERFDFSPSYALVSTSIYAHASIGGIHDVRSLKGFGVGVQAADACAEQLARAGIKTLHVFPTYEALLAAAARQDVKLLCLDEFSADYQLYRLGLHRTYVKAFDLTRDQLRRAVRKGDMATLALVERGMAQISASERQALHDKWMGRPLVSERYARRLVQVLVALGGLVLLLVVGLASVRRAVRVRTGELERERAQLRTLLENSPDLVWLKDREGVYQACNTPTASIFGWPREQILGRRDSELFDPATAEQFARDDAAAVRAGGPMTFEETAPTGRGRELVFETIKTPVIRPDGTFIGVLGVARDISERREHERTIREQERLLKEMSALAQIGAWEIDLATEAFHWTEELARIYEIPPGLPITPALCTACYAEEDRELIGRTLDAAAKHGRPFTIELEMVSGAGKRKWVRSVCGAVFEGGRPVKLRGTVQDVTQRRDLEESMRMANLLYQTSREAIVVTDEENRIVDANPAFTRQTGDELGAVLGTTPRLFASRMHDAGFYERLWQALLANGHWQGEILDRNPDGSLTAKYADIRVIRHADGRVHRHVVQFHDISEQKQKDELIWRQTNFDALTGLPNRRLFLDRLEQDLKKAQGAGQGLGVLLLDLDRFKEINDSYGHAMGDRALVEMTRRLARCVPGEATIARLGSNMFALVVSEFDGRRHLETTADAVIGAIAEPLELGPGDVAYVSASVGISVFPDDGVDAAELVRNAEQAVYLAKGAGRGRFHYFTPALQQHARDKLALTNDLRAALARNQLQVHYQPIVETATGRIRKAETLLRWQHHEHGMISPARFIPLAEEAGLIHEIGEWVLVEAIASIERWQRAYGIDVELSVNVSPVQFEQRSGLPWLTRVVNAGLPPNSITIEITEGVLVSDAEQVRRCLDALHEAGARVSIDDFGTGFSSLSYLKQFDVDYLKIDKSFINHLTEDGSDKALTEAIVDLAHRLGIEAIAEGVETAAQRDILAAFGCDYIQGWHFSPAVPREAFEVFLERQMVT